MLNKMLAKDPIDGQHYAPWREELEGQRKKFPMSYPDRDDVIAPQHAVQVRGRARSAPLCNAPVQRPVGGSPAC